MMRGSTIAGLAVVLAAMAAACDPLAPTPITAPIGSPLTQKQPLMADFDRNLAIWQASGITQYAFTYTPSCFCPLVSHLIVSEGTEFRIDGITVDSSAPPPIGTPVGVDGLFAIVQLAIKGDYATVGYDESTGVPTTMDSDPIGNAVDDELAFHVTDWTLDPPDDRVIGRITTARRLWDRQGLQDYNWSIRIACECQDDERQFDITVRDGEVATVRSGTKQIAFDPIDPAEPFSVARLFDITTYGATTVETTIEFDVTFGYPTLVEIHDDRPDAVPFWSLRVLSFAVQ
jgi:hypothetical protein